jgi:serine/threonine-protein kinase
MELEIMAAVSRADAQRLSTRALDTALALDPGLAEAHATLADVRFYWAWDWDGAGTAYRRALELNPSLADARVRYAYHLAAMGRVDEGLAEVRRAQDIDPWSPHGGDVGMMLLYARRYDEAVAQLEQRIEQEPDQALRRFTLARAYSAAGRVDDALREIARAMDLSGGPGKDKPFELEFARISAQAGRTADARRVLDRTHGDAVLDSSPLLQAYRGFVHAALDEPGPAVEWFERAAGGRSAQLLWVDVDPRFEPVRGDARFERLVDRIRSGR